MRRAFLGLISLTLVANPQVINAATNIKAGSTCPKLNQTQTINSIKYTCIKSGKKLVWNKGISTKNNQKKIDLNNNSNEKLNPYSNVKFDWSNLIPLNDAITYKIWDEWQLKQSNSKQPLIKRQIIISPNTKLDTVNPEAVFEKSEKIFSWAKLPTEYRVLYFTKLDEEWAKNTIKELYSIKDDFNFQSCRATFCLGGNVIREGNQTIHVNISRDYHLTPSGILQTLQNTDEAGGLELHEFVHVVQYNYGDPNRGLNVPAWILEGGATFFSTIGLSKNRDTYRYKRFLASETYRHAPEIIEQKISDLFEKSPDSYFGDNYTLGFFAVEALSGIYGLDSTFKLIQNSSKMGSFEEGFKVTYGEDWNQAKPKLIKAMKHLILLSRGF